MEPTLIKAQIDLSAVAHNVKELRRISEPAAKLMAVVKADGYGHGAEQIAGTALQNGADCLAVARIEEALALREAGIEAQILILGYTPPALTPILVENDITQTIFTFPMAQAYADAVPPQSKKLRCHLKIDTGMGRLGMMSDPGRLSHTGKMLMGHSFMEIESIKRLPELDVEGIYTHFACADQEDKSHARMQLDKFSDLLEKLWLSGIEFAVRHAANSAAIIDLPESHLDLVRPGIAIYGLYPSKEVRKDRLDLRPAMTFASKVIHVKNVPADFSVSYGATYKTSEPTTLATVAAGYADGVNRLLSNTGRMLVHGKSAPIVGRVCMDLTIIDVGHIPNVEVDDEVVIFGSQEEDFISADEVAEKIGTINYEVVTSISKRVPRVYIQSKGHD
jgi:alanine racemase